MDDFRKLMYGVLTAFVAVLVVWVSFVYISACGFTFTCQRGQPSVAVTPIPTLAAATLPAPDFSVESPTIGRCRVAAVDLIGAWVTAGISENEAFTFTDVDGTACQATFADVLPLFLESNIWYSGSLSCSSCHGPDLAAAIMNLNLSTYEGILAGSGRANGEPQGKDILGGGVWEESLMYQMLYAPDGKSLIAARPAMPLGRPPDVPAEGPIIFAGTPSPENQ